MTTPAIRVENLGKKYLISHQQRERYTALRDVLTNKVKGLGRRIIDLGRSSVTRPSFKEEFWALKDVSFEVQPGERIGIIGRNGAGKSTLLKLLSRITEPSAGRIGLNGRVGSLLEVGTGFHPELTGRENIFLNGAILGMSKEEIKRRFDEIVAFAEVERFIDTPVKRYSSGMYVRLAFAVAAHLDTETLLVDEVLAVGDSSFQKKCLGKMEDVGKRGRAILFVSHNMGAINRLCEKCLFLEAGSLRRAGNAREVIESYLQEGASESLTWINEDNRDRGEIAVRAIHIRQEPQETVSCVLMERPFKIELEVEIRRAIQPFCVGVRVLTMDGLVVLHTASAEDEDVDLVQPGRRSYSCEVPAFLLNRGTYALTVGADIPYQRVLFFKENVLTWSVESSSAQVGRYAPADWKGLVGPMVTAWETHVLD